MSAKRPEQTTAAGWFGAMADSYDSLIHRAVPRYEEMLRTLLARLPARAERVLELGCGTGPLTLGLAVRFPDASLTLVDAAPEMLAVTRERLAAAHPGVLPRTRFLEARFEGLDLPNASFDLVTSSISLHHVLDKAALYRALHAVLTPGGTLCFADQLRGATDEIHAQNWGEWLAFCREPGHCTPEEIEGLIDHADAHDSYVSLADHFRALEAAGFVHLDCVWRNGMWGVVCATRA